MIIRTCSILFMFLFSWNISVAQDSTFTIKVDKEKIFIGEQIKLDIKATIPVDNSIEWLTIDSLDHFEVIDRSKVDTQRNASEFILKQTITLTSWDSGSWRLPSFEYNGETTRPIRIEVTHSPMDYSRDYHDVKDILEIKKPVTSTWHWLLVLLALLLLLFLLLFPRRKKKEKPDFVPDPGIYKTSLARLSKLEKSGITDPKVFYTELVDIFRAYLNKRKGILSHSKTTDDLGVQIRNLNMPNDLYNQLLQTLRLSDFVKYAKYQPSTSENKVSINIIRDAIHAIEQK